MKTNIHTIKHLKENRGAKFISCKYFMRRIIKKTPGLGGKAGDDSSIKSSFSLSLSS
jgi:hypothetical protein